MRRALRQLLACFIATLALSVLVVFAVSDSQVRGALIVMIVVGPLLLTLWLAVRAARAIKAESPQSEGLRRLGVVLGWPAAIPAVAALGVGLVIPFSSLRDICLGFVKGDVPGWSLLFLPTSLLLLATADYMIRTSLGVPIEKPRRVRIGVLEMNEFPSYVRIVLLAYLFALLASLILFSVTLGISDLQAAQLVWRPVTSLVLVVVSLLCATWIVRRRDRAPEGPASAGDR